MHNFLNIQRI